MTPQLKLFSLFIFLSFFLQIQGYSYYVPCKQTNRACPSNYRCSKDGVFCLKKGMSKVRSKWSILQSECLDGTKCGPDHFCLDHKNECITKDISKCDSYLDFISTIGCKNQFFTEQFETCSNFYLNQYNSSNQHVSAMLCADLCMREKLSNGIQEQKLNPQNHSPKDSCSKLEQHFISNYTECYANCGACFVPSIWPQIFNVKKWVNSKNFSDKFSHDFAKICNKQYLEEKDTNVMMEIKTMGNNLTHSILEHLNVDVKNEFKDLEELNAPSTSISFHRQKFFWILLGISGVFLIAIIILAHLLKNVREKNERLILGYYDAMSSYSLQTGSH